LLPFPAYFPCLSLELLHLSSRFDFAAKFNKSSYGVGSWLIPDQKWAARRARPVRAVFTTLGVLTIFLSYDGSYESIHGVVGYFENQSRIHTTKSVKLTLSSFLETDSKVFTRQ